MPGANAGKPDVGGAAKDAAKKTPFGFINVGDLAFDLPGSNTSKDDLPNNVKPGDAAGLPKGPTAKPPSGPSLPKVRLATLLAAGTALFFAAGTALQREVHCAKHSLCRTDKGTAVFFSRDYVSLTLNTSCHH